MEASEGPNREEPNGATELNLGVKLRRAREAQDLSLDDVAAELRISAPSLQALEECRFEALAPAVFAKGYLRHYAARLGLDVKEIVAEYERMVGQTDVAIAPSKTIRLRDERQITVWIVAGLALALLAVLLAAWWLRQPGQVWGPPAAAAGTNVPAPAQSGSATEPEPAPSSPQPSAAADTRDAELAAAEAAVRPASGRESGASRASAPAANRPAADGEAASGPVADPVEQGSIIEIVFIEDSWAEVTAADGERLYRQLGLAGATARFPADDGLRLFFGNARGVEIRLDGETVAIPSSARRGDLAQLELGDLRRD